MPASHLVLSVPAGKTYAIINRHLVYSCPAAYTYKSTPMITFRTAPPAAAMEKVFTIQQIELADPLNIQGTCTADTALRARIAAYVAAARPAGVLVKTGKYRFYILDPKDVLPLPHAPTSIEPSKGPLYFSLADLQSGNPMVTPLPPLTYKEKLLDARWITKRDRIRAERGAKCELCGSTENLDIHHGYYSPFLEPWEYDDGSLWALCRSCHNGTQLLLTSIHMTIGFTHPRELERLKPRIADATFEARMGISTAEAEEILREERHIQATLYSDYTAEITACPDLGPSIARQLENLAVQAFPGIEVSITEKERDRDGNVCVSGPNPDIVDHLQAFLDREREKRA